MTVHRFTPTGAELYDYYRERMMQKSFADTQTTRDWYNPSVEYPKWHDKWLYGQRRSLLKFGFALGCNFIRLAPFQKSPPPVYEHEPLTYLQAMRYFRTENGWAGWRGAKHFAHLDYDAAELTPALEELI